MVSFLGSEPDDDTVVSCYKEVIDILIEMQEVDVKGSVVETRSFDENKFCDESKMSIEYFMGSYLGADEGVTNDEQFINEIKNLNKVLASREGKVFLS